MACIFNEILLINCMLSSMLIGWAAQMIVAPLAATASFLGITLSLRALENKQWSPILAPKPSTGLLLTPLLNYNGYNLFLRTLAYSWQPHPHYGVITLALHNLPPIQRFMPTPSISKLTSILSVIK